MKVAPKHLLSLGTEFKDGKKSYEFRSAITTVFTANPETRERDLKEVERICESGGVESAPIMKAIAEEFRRAQVSGNESPAAHF